MTAAMLLLAIPPLTLEVSGGAAIPVFSSEYDGNTVGYPVAPVLRATALLGASPHISAGLSVSAVLGGEGRDHKTEPAVPVAGFEGWGASLVLRAHSLAMGVGTDGPNIDFYAQAGAGVGQLISMQTGADVEHAWLRGRAAPVFELTAGGSASVSPSLSLGLQGTWLMWTRVGQDAYEMGGGFPVSSQANIVAMTIFVAATVAFTSPL